MYTNKIKTGLAAFGMSGQIFHAPFITTHPAFELTAIVERSKELSKERYPSAKIVRSFEELIAMDELELIVVNTPDSTHFDYARRALEAGEARNRRKTVYEYLCRRRIAGCPCTCEGFDAECLPKPPMGFGFPYG